MVMPPGVKFLPNAITVLALCAGLSAVAFAHRADDGSMVQWFYAAAMIATAAILDSLDGPAARLLNSTSRMGAELDSLSDCVSFGIAPALVMYLWVLDDHPIGWAMCLVYAVCTTLRLARFNSLLDDENPKPWARGFFTGVPSPAGALLAIQPMLLWYRFGEGWWSNGWLVGLWMVFIGALMISRIPSIALKSVYIPTSLVLLALVGLVVGVALLFYEPIIVLAIGLLVYLAHLPYAWWKYRYVKRHPEMWYESNRRRRIRTRNARRLRPRLSGRRRVAGRTRDGRRLPPIGARRNRPGPPPGQQRRSPDTSAGSPEQSGNQPGSSAGNRPGRLGRRRLR